MVFLPCLGHQLDLIASRVYGTKKQMEFLGEAQDLIATINASRLLLSKYKLNCQVSYGVNKGIALQNLVRTRWDSAHKMLCSILRVRTALEKTCTKNQDLTQNIPADLRNEEGFRNFIQICKQFEEVLRPLSIASKLMQHRTQDLGTAFMLFKDLYMGFKRLPDDESPLGKRRKVLLVDIQKRWHTFEQPLFFSACVSIQGTQKSF